MVRWFRVAKIIPWWKIQNSMRKFKWSLDSFDFYNSEWINLKDKQYGIWKYLNDVLGIIKVLYIWIHPTQKINQSCWEFIQFPLNEKCINSRKWVFYASILQISFYFQISGPSKLSIAGLEIT